MCRIEIKGRLVAGFPEASEPPCYCQRFGVSMLILSWCELKRILKGIASGVETMSWLRRSQMFIDFVANQCLALQRSTMCRKMNTSNFTFRSAGAKNLLERMVYTHSVPPG